MAAMKRSFLGVLFIAACASRGRTIPGTRVADTDLNRELIKACEAYRVAMEAKDTESLLLLASPDYWEDGGTPAGSDDYGFDGLREVLSARLSRASQIRFSMRYVGLQVGCKEAQKGCRANVDVLVDASFSVLDARGVEQRPDMRDQNRLELVHNGTKWQFTAGM